MVFYPDRKNGDRGSTMTKTITILGVTGSIGTNTAELVQANPEKFRVKSVIAQKSVDKLTALAKSLNAETAVIADETKYKELKSALSGSGIKVLAGKSAVMESSSDKVDIFLSSAVGFCALEPTLNAIRAGSNIGLANKECLVCAGSLMVEEVAKAGVKLLPIDSEHNSLYQIFDFAKKDDVEKIILTASGGPFRNFSKDDLATVTPQMAIKHPNWSMGAKISVDSATLMNKGLEIIEAYYLFPVRKDQIDILVHPQSIIHGLVTYKDGSVLAGMSFPDMKIPISFALGYPERLANDTKRINLAEIGSLTFEKPDYDKFHCLNLSKQALELGAKAPIALNAANEVAVESFLSGKISFVQIPYVVEMVVEKIISSARNTIENLDHVFAIDTEARNLAEQLVKGKIQKKVA
jgi:1-deoxy-D-xylulose-5-phosphate reductoisomerase